MRGRLEVALLVEDIVEGQQHLLLGEGETAAGEQRGDVAGVLAGSGCRRPGTVPHEDGAGRRSGRRRARPGPAAGGRGRTVFEEIGGRVAADGELREDDEIGAELRRRGR